MAARKAYKVRKRGNGWQANLSRRVTGDKRIQITRPTKAEAEAEAERQLQTLTDYGADYLNFNPVQLRACREAIRHLEEAGFPATAVADAVRLYTEHNDPQAQRRTVAEVLAEFLASKNQAGLSPFTLSGYRQKLTRFSKHFGDHLLHTITPTEIEQWLDSVKAHGTTRGDYRRNLSIFYRFAIGRKYAKENAAAAVTKVKIRRPVPAILSTEDVRRLLGAARERNGGRMLPYFAIGCFAGLRPWETRRTSWENVDLEGKEIYVTPAACKTTQDRYVTMPDNLVEWLRRGSTDESRHGTIYYSRADFNAIREAAGMTKAWRNDVMRHSAASHLYAKTQNASLVTAQMGHGLNVFMKHYKNAVTKAEGEAYFAVSPGDGGSGKVDMKQAAS